VRAHGLANARAYEKGKGERWIIRWFLAISLLLDAPSYVGGEAWIYWVLDHYLERDRFWPGAPKAQESVKTTTRALWKIVPYTTK
jgi:hypothetical protein